MEFRPQVSLPLVAGCLCSIEGFAAADFLEFINSAQLPLVLRVLFCIEDIEFATVHHSVRDVILHLRQQSKCFTCKTSF